MKTLRVIDVAKKLGVSRSTILRWLAAGEGPEHVKTPGGTVLFTDPTAVAAWLDSLKAGGHSAEQEK